MRLSFFETVVNTFVSGRLKMCLFLSMCTVAAALSCGGRFTQPRVQTLQLYTCFSSINHKVIVKKVNYKTIGPLVSKAQCGLIMSWEMLSYCCCHSAISN